MLINAKIKKVKKKLYSSASGPFIDLKTVPRIKFYLLKQKKHVYNDGNPKNQPFNVNLCKNSQGQKKIPVQLVVLI